MERKSFGRRRSRSLGYFPTDETCEMIDQSLPEHDRLFLLARYAMETAFIKAEKELIEDTDEDSRLKCIMTFETALEEEDLCKEACADIEVLTTSMNAECSEVIAECYKGIEKLSNEGQSWDEMFAKFRKNHEEEANVESISFDDKELIRKEFDKYDCSEMLGDVATVKGNLGNQLTIFENLCIRLQAKLDKTGTLMNVLEDNVIENLSSPTDETPRRLIKNCFE